MLKRILILRPEDVEPAVALAGRIAGAVEDAGVEARVAGAWGHVPRRCPVGR